MSEVNEDFFEQAKREIEAEEEADKERKERAASAPKYKIDTNDPYFNRWLGWKLENIQNTIQHAVSGERHNARLAGGRVLGGLAGSGYLGFEEAIDIGTGYAEANTEHPKDAAKDIRDSVKNGMKSPIPYTFKPERVDPDYDPNGPEEIDNNNNNNNKEGEPKSIQEGDEPIWEGVYYPILEEEPPDSEPLLTFLGVKIASKGNFTVFTAPTGYGKSNLLTTAAASVFMPEFEIKKFDCLNFASPAGTKVLYIDTEQDKHDAWVLKKRSLGRVDIIQTSDIPDAFKFVNIRGMASNALRLEFVLYHLRHRINHPDIVYIDGIGDLVSGVNEEKECIDLISTLSAISHNLNIAIVISLHGNHNDPLKLRGHLGSEVERKASFIISVEKLKQEKEEGEEIYEVTNLKHRSTKKAKAHYKFDEDIGMHVTCDGTGKVTPTKKLKDRNRLYGAMDSAHGYFYKEIMAIGESILGIGSYNTGIHLKDLINAEKVNKIDNLYWKV